MAYGISNYGTPDEDYEDRTGLMNFSLTGDVPAGAMIDPIEGTFSWTPSPQQMGQELRIAVRVGYAMAPAMSEIIVLRLAINGPVFLEPPRIDGLLHQTIIRVRVPDDRIFRVQYTDDAGSPSPVWSTLGFAYGEIVDPTWPLPPLRLYRAVFDP
jgi:hypothetical protein